MQLLANDKYIPGLPVLRSLRPYDTRAARYRFVGMKRNSSIYAFTRSFVSSLSYSRVEQTKTTGKPYIPSHCSC